MSTRTTPTTTPHHEGAAPSATPSATPPAYDPRLERMDVAIRAVLKVSVGNWSNWEQAGLLGLSKEKHAARLLNALAEIDTTYREDDLFALVKRCPFLVEAAQMALALYQEATRETRDAYFGRVSIPLPPLPTPATVAASTPTPTPTPTPTSTPTSTPTRAQGENESNDDDD